jgi:secondary thiamine-phosphate synthase enzyme
LQVSSFTISLSTQGNADSQDITQQVSQKLAESGLQSGTLTVFTSSSTSALTTIEFESGALNDLKRLLDEIVDPGRHYDHNARWGDGNGHSHVRAALLGPSLSIPFTDAQLRLGTWQQIVFLDFDNRPRQRELVVQIVGE